jgi:hypothetical protein
LIEGACENYDTSNGKIIRSLCSAVAMISAGKRYITIDQDLIVAHDLVQNKYKTKLQIALELKKLVCIKIVITDDLCATEKMFSILIKAKFYFEMRFHANPIVEYNGKKLVSKRKEILNFVVKNLPVPNLLSNSFQKCPRKSYF